MRKLDTFDDLNFYIYEVALEDEYGEVRCSALSAIEKNLNWDIAEYGTHIMKPYWKYKILTGLATSDKCKSVRDYAKRILKKLDSYKNQGE